VYDAKLFVMKNQERIDAEHVEVLHASSLPTLPAMLVAAAEETIHPPCTSTAASAAKKDTSGPGKRQRQRSVVSQFQSSLDTLLSHFAEAQACYIRCIKPNAAGIPKQFDDDKVLEQLRNNGVVETIKISTQSFPRSILFDSFLDLFSTLATSESAAPAALGASSGTAGTSTIDRVRTVCTSVLPHSQVETVLIGKTKVFIPQATLDVLERAVMRHRLRGVLCLQRVWRRLRADKSARRAAEAEASQAEVAKAYAAKKARRRNRRDAARASFATLMSEPAEQVQTAAAATKISSASGHPRFNNDLSSSVTNVVVAPQRRPTREVAPLTETTDSPHDTVWFGVSVVPYMLLPMLKAAVAYEKRGGTAMFKSKSTLSRYPLPSVTTFCAQRTPVPNAHRLPAICASEAALGLRWLIE
jgi:myosin heavy subunit